MKRKPDCTVYQNTRSKYPKLSPGISIRTFKPFISASKLRNYFNKDTLVDWLKRHSNRNGTQVPNHNIFSDFIMNRGIEFEDKIVECINSKITPVTTISNIYSTKGLRDTIVAIQKGLPVIHWAQVRDRTGNMGGIIDLLVRSDYLGLIVQDNPLTEEEVKHRAPNLSGNYHYIVVDIKFTTIPLRADGKFILNTGNFPAYKSQTWVYTKIIGQIQGYTSRYAFILGRRWKYTQKDISYEDTNCFSKLGTIDFTGIDNGYIDQTKDAVKWLTDVYTNGDKWTLIPPSRPELYPNMCVDSGEWNAEKEKIATQLGDITQLWHCGAKQRNIGFANGIYTWRDPKCTARLLGINGKRAPIIDAIIGINRDSRHSILPLHIKTNFSGWRTPGNEVFVDFETIADIFASFDDIPSQYHTGMIFMIGVGYIESDEWVYKNFLCNSLDKSEEYRIMDEFANFIRSRNNPKMWFWNAEQKLWSGASNRQYDYSETPPEDIRDKWNIWNWADLYGLFLAEPIVVKGCFKFGLKEISKAMRKHRLIDTLCNSNCDNGMNACIRAWNCYQNSNNPESTQEMSDIMVYNEFDCKVLYDILDYLRDNH